MKWSYLGVATLIVSTLSLQAGAPQSVTVKVGDAFNFAISSNASTTTTMMGSDHVSNANTTIQSTLRATDVKDGATTFDVHYDHAVIKTEGMAMMMIPDTTFHIDEFKDAKETLTVDSKGHVVKRDVTPPVATDNQQKMLLRQLVGRNLLRGIFVGFPDKALSKGDTWTVSNNDTVDAGNGKVMSTMSLKCTYLGEVDTLGMHCGRVDVKSEKFIISGTMKQMGREVSIDGDGVVKSSYLFDTATGVAVAIKSNSQIDQRITMGEGMEIPMSIDSKTTITRSH